MERYDLLVIGGGAAGINALKQGVIQLAALAIRTGAAAALLGSQLSIQPSHGERIIKMFGHDHHEVCEPDAG